MSIHLLFPDIEFGEQEQPYAGRVMDGISGALGRRINLGMVEHGAASVPGQREYVLTEATTDPDGNVTVEGYTKCTLQELKAALVQVGGGLVVE